MSKSFKSGFHAGMLDPEAYLNALTGLPKEKPLRECILPGCINTHRHNGGYCCAEHSRAHKELQKKRHKR